ncbi:chromosome transmission fidelity protein 18 homolog [Eriocheir sinensis]|uniref:chromosome transmission fidelity protein 18 homolog n=1 Tax=Eriocheir sinensis TaxID=95602 RepID=UPI0021C66C59|nr:chromosome transmission fidelity protein 18 homolog [Eriocheir sinensis]
MDEYPDLEDEFEAQHAAELEMMREMEEFNAEEAALQASAIPPSHKRSLTFTSPVSVPSSGEPPSTLSNVSQESRDVAASRKRGVEEDMLLDDLNSFFDDRGSNRNKRQKSLLPEVDIGLRDPTLDLAKHEADLALMDRIMEIRQTKETADHPNQTSTVAPARKKHVTIHRRVPDEAFQAITTEAGDRFYLNCLEEDEWDRSIASVTSSQHKACLLNTSYSTLKAQALQEQIRLDALHAKRLAEEEDSGMESGAEEDSGNNEELWVEKFKPRQYLHLLSDESTNRNVLHWIKLWDKVVFGRDTKQINNTKKDNKIKGKLKKFQKKPEVITELDDHNRPMQKVLLLCGPPGLGKTTLAHITATHAGYNVVEINASDDNSLEIFRTRLENATSMQAVLGPDPRPNCLVIDEIDGAPAPSINLLVNMLSGKDIGKKKKKLKGPILLQRPVICICNELYTPALRPLRQMALVVKFPPTHTPKLAQRLHEISLCQRLKADLSVLVTLCEKTENDIRSCLSVLQFVRSNKKKLSMSDVCGISVGQKDYKRSLLKIWQEIFTIPRQKRIRHNPLEETPDRLTPMPDLNGDMKKFEEQNTLAFRFQHILKVAQHAPYERVMQGWFENYLSLKQFTLLDSIKIGLEWTLFTDLQLREIMHSQSWTLMAYLPYACVSHHLRFASLNWSNIQFPTVMQENNQKLTKNHNLLSAMINDMSPMTRAFTSNKQLVMDVLPLLIHIIQPTLRPVSSQLYSKEEQQELANLVDTMIGYNLTYTQEKNPQGHYTFVLDPNVEEIVYFDENSSAKKFSYYSRQLISREIDLEKVRRAEAYFTEKMNDTSTKAASTAPPSLQQPNNSASTKEQTPAKSSTSSTPAIPSHKQKLHPQMNDSAAFKGEKAVAPKDFFGRIVKQKENENIRMIDEATQSDIWFHFNEGYCNAVRKTVLMKDLVIQ